MAIYVYSTGMNTYGELYSWCPSDTDPVASDSDLASQSMAKKSGLPPLDATHVWDVPTQTVVVITAPTPANICATYDFIMAFTAAELANIRAASDNNIQRFLYALEVTQGVNLNDTTINQSLQYLVNHSFLTQARMNAILNTITSGGAQ